MEKYSQQVIDKLDEQGLRSVDCLDILDICHKYVEGETKVIKMKAVKGFAQLYTDLRTAQKSKNFTDSNRIQKQLDEACKKILK